MVPYREEMAKRHLKVPGDLGRVNFIVRALAIRNCGLSARLPRPRNTICETPSRSRRQSDTPTSFTT